MGWWDRKKPFAHRLAISETATFEVVSDHEFARIWNPKRYSKWTYAGRTIFTVSRISKNSFLWRIRDFTFTANKRVRSIGKSTTLSSAINMVFRVYNNPWS